VKEYQILCINPSRLSLTFYNSLKRGI